MYILIHEKHGLSTVYTPLSCTHALPFQTFGATDLKPPCASRPQPHEQAYLNAISVSPRTQVSRSRRITHIVIFRPGSRSPVPQSRIPLPGCHPFPSYHIPSHPIPSHPINSVDSAPLFVSNHGTVCEGDGRGGRSTAGLNRRIESLPQPAEMRTREDAGYHNGKRRREGVSGAGYGM